MLKRAVNLKVYRNSLVLTSIVLLELAETQKLGKASRRLATYLPSYQSSFLRPTSLLYPIPKFKPPKRHTVALNRKKSIFKQTLRRWTNMLYG